MATLKSLLSSAVDSTLTGKNESLRSHIENAQQSNRAYSSGLEYKADGSPQQKRQMIDNHMADQLAGELYIFLENVLDDLAEDFADAIMSYLLSHRTVEYGSNGNLIGYSGTPIQGSTSGRVSYPE